MQLPPALNQMNTMQGQPQDDMSSQMPQEGMNENIPEPEQILAHVSPDEIPFLNELQRQEIIDPETGLRDYTMIEYLLDIPEYRQGMEEAAGLMKSKKMAEGGHISEQGRPIAPELEELRKAGRHGDTELIIITPKIADFFETIHEGKTTINPITGFPEYGFFKELFRIAAPIVGAVFGGPVGAFAASTAANKVTGKSWGDSLKQGAFSAGLSLAAPIAGGYFQSAFPGISGAMGQGARGLLGQTFGGGLANAFTPGAGSGILAALGGGAAQTGSGPVAATGAAGKAAGAGAAGQGGQGMLGGIMNLGGGVLPLAAAGLMLAKGHQQEKKEAGNYDEKQRQDIENLRQKYGFNTPWREVKPLNRELQTEYSPEDRAMGREHSFFKNNRLGNVEYMKDGGVIRGMGKGQQDNIPKNLKEGSYIIDASSVSDLGDGSSQAGIKELDKFFSKIPSHPIHKRQGGYIDALLSTDEYEIPSEKVTALGNGSNAEGAKIIKSMIKSLRQSKRTSGDKLPPKAKPIGGYLKNMRVA